MNKTNILIITDTYVGWPGGSERHLYNFLSNVDCEKFNIHTVQMSYLPLPYINNEIFKVRECVNLIYFPIQKILSISTLRLVFNLRRLIITNRISLVISYHEKSDIINYVIGKLFGIKIVQISSKRDLGFKQSNRLKTIIDFVTPRLKNITAPSQSIIDQMQDVYGSDTINAYYIPNGVDLDKFKPCSLDDKAKVKKKLGLSSNKYFLAVVGSLTEIKGHMYLIDAFVDFCVKSRLEWDLIIIGDGPLKNTLLNQAKQNNKSERIKFVGVQDNIGEWLQSIDILISASYSEGLSNALIEGAATALPIIATNVGGNPEIVIEGFNGLLIKPRCKDDIVEALNKFDTQPELLKLYGDNSRELVKNKYSIGSMVNKLETLYAKLAG